MDLQQIRRIHLVGICGTAMASLAGLLQERGFEVTGSDSHMYPPMSTQLQGLGIRFFSEYSSENLSAARPDLVIPGNAIPRGNPELEAVLNSRLLYVSMAEAIKEFFLREKRSIVVAGTHGKTTTSSMIAWLLKSTGLEPSFLVGGVPINFAKSYQWEQKGRFFVIEGDEYDTGFMDRRPKFVSYLPEIVILNAVEYDHADIYTNFAAVEEAFRQLIKVVPGNGMILVNRDSEAAYKLARQGYSRVLSFGFHRQSDFPITEASWRAGEACFQLKDTLYRISTFGAHNIANAAAAAVLGGQIGIQEEQIQKALAAFQGVKKRMELRGEEGGIAVYDDFAHHPTAISTTLEGARLAFPQSRVWGIFEPRSWSSRRNIFQTEFARAFGSANIAIIAGVYQPEKLATEIRLDPEKLVADIGTAGTESYFFPEASGIIEFVSERAQPGDKLILMSNGSFDGLHDRLLDMLKTRNKE